MQWIGGGGVVGVGGSHRCFSVLSKLTFLLGAPITLFKVKKKKKKKAAATLLLRLVAWHHTSHTCQSSCDPS